MSLAIWAILVIGSYVLGGIPFGYILGRMKGIDIRAHGSRNIGATNVARLFGKGFGTAVFLLDMCKGLAPTILTAWLVARRSQSPTTLEYLLWSVVASAAIVGHIYPIALGFRGGKGVATALGATMGVYPYLTWPALVCFAIWLVVTAATRIVSLGSLIAIIAFPFLVLLSLRPLHLDLHWPLLAYAFFLAALVIARHRGNIARLLDGTESRIGASKHD